MAKIVGRRIAVGIGAETTRGTAVSPTFWVPKLGLDFEDKLDKAPNESSFNVIEKQSNAGVVLERGEGNIEGKIRDKSFGLLLSAVFGKAPTSAANADPSGNVYDHTYTRQNDNEHRSLTIAVKDPNYDRAFPNAIVDSFKLTAELDQFLMFECGFMSKKSETASNTPSFSTDENEFLPKHLSLVQADDLAGLGAGSAVNIRNFELEVSKNPEAIHNLGNTTPDDWANKVIEITGSYEAYYNGTTNRDLAFDNSRKALRFKAVNTDATIGTSANPLLQFDLGRVDYTNYERDMGNDDIVVETVEFTGEYSLSDAMAIQALLTNEVASY